MGGGEGRASICGRMRRAPLPENPVKPVLALCCALLLVPSALAAETLKYVALVDGGKKAGEQTVTTGDDGVTRVDTDDLTPQQVARRLATLTGWLV